MIVRRLEEIIGTERDVQAKTWNSRRLLLKRDGFGYSLHDTRIFAGTETTMWYKHHIEAVYCVTGEGELVDHETGAVHAIRPGTLYVLDRHDRHTLRAKTELRLFCVFTPALTGQEVHDASGAYPPPEEAEAKAR
ncbi:MAG: ectoine synthase [Hydrogenibacillus schlegelii]|uniref:L-ectoine synthase n=1 Tax=Hydrogenibacillus schlegelii TaxID=1484 RepID=A0A947CX34_HYDSH|nr:ectoine synthase [Hydrogenibacillus schlegelii]